MLSRHLLMLVPLLLILVPATQAHGADKAIARELKKDQGTWQFTGIVTKGKKTPAENLESMQLTIKGNQWEARKGKETILKGTYKIVAVKGKVRHTEVTVTDGPGKGKTFLGISMVAGKTRKGCLAQPGDPRPTKFESTADNENTVLTYKRVPAQKK